MIRSYTLSCMLLLSMASLQAFQLTSENLWEIDRCWRAIFDEQIENWQHDRSAHSQLEDLKKILLTIDEADAEVAGQLIMHLCQGNLWDNFVEYKSVDTTVAYLDLLKTALQHFIGGAECTLEFPPKLHEIDENMGSGSLDKMQYLARVRQSFLAFTIIVSKMDYLARQ
ncbi:MAG: hypothetical protein WD055_02180 [Candidatus Dependentiae bacterium]